MSKLDVAAGDGEGEPEMPASASSLVLEAPWSILNKGGFAVPVKVPLREEDGV